MNSRAYIKVSLFTVTTAFITVLSPSVSLGKVMAGPIRHGEVAGVIRQTESLNKAAQNLGHLNTSCLECGTTPEPTVKPQYESCTEKNNYLQTELGLLGRNDTINTLMNHRPTDSHQALRMQSCIRESMSLGGGPFRTCEGSSYSKKKIQKACLSEDIVTITQNSFDLSMMCLTKFVTGKDDDSSIQTLSNSFFSLINLESGFHSNAVSGTGAGGLGQLTSSAIKDVNRLVWDDIKKTIDNSTSPSCAQIKKMNIQPMNPGRSNACERIGLSEGNPMRNLLVTIGYQKLIRDQLNKSISKGSIKSTLDKMDPAKKEELLDAVMKWGHNTGPMSIIRPFLNLATSQNGKQMLQVGQVDGFLKSMSSYVREYHINRLETPRARANEASGFYARIQNKLAAVEKNAGGKKCAIQ